MKKLTLSNGAVIEACVGDGFDGDSGVYITHPDLQFKHDHKEIPKKDRKKVRELLMWYAKKEIELRFSEGNIYNSFQKERKIPTHIGSPDQAAYYAGSLK